MRKNPANQDALYYQHGCRFVLVLPDGSVKYAKTRAAAEATAQAQGAALSVLQDTEALVRNPRDWVADDAADKAKTQRRAEELCRLGLEGRLTEAEFTRQTPSENWGFLLRHAYTHNVSWSVYTTDYADSLARLFRNVRVLEVCAGAGVLKKMMDERGIEWDATDAKLSPLALQNGVRQCDALEAAENAAYDALFVSWIPHESPLDSQLAEICTRRKKMFVLLGEDCGCTGSVEFWQDNSYKSIDPATIDPQFRDVPQWDSLHEHTVIVRHR